MRVVEIDSSCVSNMPKSFDEEWIKSGAIESQYESIRSYCPFDQLDFDWRSHLKKWADQDTVFFWR